MRFYAGTRLYRTLRHPRGMILITATWIAIALAAVVLVLCREMMVESLTARQHLDQAKADAAEQGMEQFVCSVLEQEYQSPGYKEHTDWEQRRVGDSYAWVMMYNPDDETTPAFGITDEGAKVDLNTATDDMIALLPNLDQDEEFVYEVQDWIDPDDDLANGTEGAETSDYEGAVNYRAKNAPFESVEELRLLLSMQDKQMAEFILHGADSNHNHVLDINEQANTNAGMSFDSNSMVGIEPFVTVYGLRATPLAIANAPTTSSTTSTSGISNSNSNSTLNMDTLVADVNYTTNTNGLTTVLTQYLTQARAQTITRAMAGTGRNAKQKTYKNIWDWAVQMKTGAQLTTDEFSEVYLHLTCSYTSGATTQASPVATASPTGSATTQAATQPTQPVGRININTAPEAVLMCLPDFTQNDADNIIAYREANFESTYQSDPTQVPNIAWLMDQIDASDTQKLVDSGYYLTGVSYVYSADIVTVSPDGRAFKRVRIVVDVSTGVPQIIYRRDMTNDGWPLDCLSGANGQSVRAVLKAGGEPQRLSPSPSGRIATGN